MRVKLICCFVSLVVLFGDCLPAYSLHRDIAAGRFSFNGQNDLLTVTILRSSFSGCGPEAGREAFHVDSVTASSMVWSPLDGGEPIAWRRAPVPGGSLYGKWQSVAADYFFRLQLRRDGRLTVSGTCQGAPELPSLVLLDTFGDAALSLSYYDNIEVSSDGVTYVLPGGAAHWSESIVFFDENGLFLGPWTTQTGDYVFGHDLLIEADDRMHVYRQDIGSSSHLVFDQAGNTLDSMVGGNAIVYLSDVGMDSLGQHFIVPISGRGSQATGRDLYVEKMSYDLQTRMGILEKTDLLAMLPVVLNEQQVTIHGVAVDNNDRIYVAIDTDSDGYDGILVLSNRLQQITYLGRDWLFNCPTDAVFDADNNMYVSNMYGDDAVLVFDSSLRQIAAVPASVFGGEGGAVRLVHRNGKIYVINEIDDRVYVFEALAP